MILQRPRASATSRPVRRVSLWNLGLMTINAIVPVGNVDFNGFKGAKNKKK
jgi:hypothetical protein